MASFRGIVNVAWDAGPAGLVVDEKCKWKRLKCLLNPKGGEHHNQARECICRPRILSDEACSPETVRELFEECSRLITLAQLDASITESAGTTDNAVVGRLRDAVVAFMTCKLLMGESWQSSWPYSSLLGTLKSLAEVLIQAAHARVYRTKEPTQQKDSSKTFNIKFADPLIRQQEPSEFMLFGTLSKAAWIYADSALKVFSGSPPQEAAFSSQGINATFTCCALVYACKLLGDLTETLAKRPDLLAAFNPADKNRPKPNPKPKPEPPVKVQKERKASSFLDKVEGEWSRAILHHDPMQTCTSLWERRPGFLDDASNLCEGFKLSDSDEDFEADGLIFRELFHDTKDKLGRALWEFFHRDCCDPYIKAVAEKTKATIKVLMQCMAKDEKWVASEQLGNLSLRVRLMTEALATAAFMRFCYEKEEDLIKPNNKQGHKKGLSELAGDLMKPTAPPEARILGALCKAAHNTVCDADLHYKPSPDLHYKPLPNRGNCIIIGCRAIVFACYNFIKVMDLPNVQDTNPEGEENKDGREGAVQEPQLFAGALPKGEGMHDPVVHVLRSTADPLPILHDGVPVWQNLGEEPVAPGLAAQSNLSAEGSAAMQGRHVAVGSQAYEARFKAFLTDLQAQTEAPVDPRPHFSIFKDKFLKLEDMYSQAHNARGDVESTLGTLRNSFGDGIFLGDFSSDQIQKNKIITAAQDIYKTSVNYVTNIDTGEWLYRVLTDEDDKHYKNIGEKLAKLVSLLREAMCKKDWPPQDKKKLEDFEQKVAGLESRRKDHAVARQKVRQAFKDQAVYLKELQEFFDNSKEAVLRECCKKMTEEKLKQAAAFARAKFDRSGTHHEIHHPDLLVLWHRGEELKQKWHAGWGEFLSHFPSKIWLEQEVRSKVEAMKHNLRHPLTGASSEDDEESSTEPQVSIDSINRVFEWRVGKRVALLDAVKSCQSNLQSKASSEGTHTPGKRATPSESGKLEDSWQDFADDLEEDVQGPALLGRDETIAHATDILVRSFGKRHLLLSGPGGIGKSSLGEAISQQLMNKDHMETASIRIDLFTARTAEDVYTALCSGLHINCKVKDEDVKHEVIKKLKRAADGASTAGLLLFLDSCEMPLAVKDTAVASAAVLQQVVKLVPKVVLLMASRTLELQNAQAGMDVHPFCHATPLTSIFQELKVAPLALEAGMQILRRGFRSTGAQHDGNAMELAKQCECIPLRLQIAAGILSSGQASYEDIQHALRGASQHGSVEAALLKWHNSEHLKALFSLSLFATAFSTRQADFMLDNLPDAAGILQELYSRRLILAVPAMPGEQLWGVHASVQAAVQGLGMAATPAQVAVDWQQHMASARIKFAQCMTAELATCAGAPPHQATRIVQAQHANVWAALEPGQQCKKIRTAISRELLLEWPTFYRGSWPYSVGKVAGLLLPSLEQLCDAAVWLLEEQGGQRAERAIDCPETAADQRLGQQLSGECFSSFVSLDDEEGKDGPRLVLSIDRPEASIERLQLLQAEFMSLRAAVLRSQGAFAAAADLQQQVLELRQELLGNAHIETLSSMYSFANSLQQEGKFNAAAEVQQQVLELRLKMLGAEHPDTLKSMHNLGICLQQQGKYAAAKDLQQQALKLQLQVLGAEHPDTLGTMHSFASCLHNLGEHATAAEMQQQVLNLRKKVLGAEHPDTLTAMSNLAICLHVLGEHATAAEMQQQVLKLRQEKVLGAEHPDTLISMDNLAISLSTGGMRFEALKMHQQVLELRLKVLRAEHPDTLVSMNNLASSLYVLGRHAEAAEMQQQLLELRQRGYNTIERRGGLEQGSAHMTGKVSGFSTGSRSSAHVHGELSGKPYTANYANSKDRPGRTPCTYFQQGRCRKGNACKFSHEARTSAVREGGSTHGMSSSIGTSGNTQPGRTPCTYFQQGRCRNGNACKFSHEARTSAVREGGSMHGMSRTPPPPPPLPPACSHSITSVHGQKCGGLPTTHIDGSFGRAPILQQGRCIGSHVVGSSSQPGTTPIWQQGRCIGSHVVGSSSQPGTTPILQQGRCIGFAEAFPK